MGAMIAHCNDYGLRIVPGYMFQVRIKPVAGDSVIIKIASRPGFRCDVCLLVIDRMTRTKIKDIE